MKSERVALFLLVLILAGLPLAVLGYQQARTAAIGVRVIDLQAQLPEEGGWGPDHLRITAGEPVRLRIHSPDVLHSFAIGRTDIGPVDILPGKVTEIDVIMDEPGVYSFYCTRWCSTNHWRMRGTIEVMDAAGVVPLSSREPAPYIALVVDLDSDHGHDEQSDHTPDREPAISTPAAPPSAAHGATLGVIPPPVGLADTPAALYEALRQMHPELGDQDLWGLVALAWRELSTAEDRALGQRLYDRDCIACHGPKGRGDGIMARDLPEPPGDWVDSAFLFDSSDALIHGKIVRGGMGTGMPGWGDIYTDDEAWALVAFLRSFSFFLD